MPTYKAGTAINRNSPLEAELTKRGYKFSYHSVPLSDITRNPASQARINLARPTVVATYAEQMRNGAKFPPYLTWDNPNTPGLTMLDGNTRGAAESKQDVTGLRMVDAYIVTGLQSDAEAVIVSSIPNLLHGQPFGKQERGRLALIMAQEGTPHTEVAKSLGVSPSAISKMLGEVKFDDRCARLGVVADDEFDRTAKNLIGRLADDAVFAQAVQLVKDAKLPRSDQQLLVKKVEAMGSEQERLQVVSDERQTHLFRIQQIADGKLKPAEPPVRQVAMVTGQLVSLDEKWPDKADWVSDVDREARLERITRARDILSEVIDAYEG